MADSDWEVDLESDRGQVFEDLHRLPRQLRQLNVVDENDAEVREPEKFVANVLNCWRDLTRWLHALDDSFPQEMNSRYFIRYIKATNVLASALESMIDDINMQATPTVMLQHLDDLLDKNEQNRLEALARGDNA